MNYAKLTCLFQMTKKRKPAKSSAERLSKIKRLKYTDTMFDRVLNSGPPNVAVQRVIEPVSPFGNIEEFYEVEEFEEEEKRTKHAKYVQAAENEWKSSRETLFESLLCAENSFPDQLCSENCTNPATHFCKTCSDHCLRCKECILADHAGKLPHLILYNDSELGVVKEDTSGFELDLLHTRHRSCDCSPTSGMTLFIVDVSGTIYPFSAVKTDY